jgi:hypothetical protein
MRILAIIRDVVVIVGVSLVCFLMVDFRMTREHERAVRMAAVQASISKLNDAYKTAVFDSSENKGIYQQMFRQNEIAIEYQKLALIRDLISADGVDLTAPPSVPEK